MGIAPTNFITSEDGCFFELRDNMFLAHDPASGITRAMRPLVFMETIARAVECARQFKPRRKCEIIDFGAHHAATGRSSK